MNALQKEMSAQFHSAVNEYGLPVSLNEITRQAIWKRIKRHSVAYEDMTEQERASNSASLKLIVLDEIQLSLTATAQAQRKTALDGAKEYTQ